MARILGVSVSGCHVWRDRAPSDRQRQDERLLRRIRTIHAVSHGTYGAPRVQAARRAGGVHVGRKRAARLMREAKIAGVSRRRRTVTATVRGCGATLRRGSRPAQLFRRGSRSAPGGRHRVHPHGRGLFCSSPPGWIAGLDARSRRIVGWAFSHDLKTRVVLDALDMALATREPQGLIHHGDKGGQHTSRAFGHRCRCCDPQLSFS